MRVTWFGCGKRCADGLRGPEGRRSVESCCAQFNKCCRQIGLSYCTLLADQSAAEAKIVGGVIACLVPIIDIQEFRCILGAHFERCAQVDRAKSQIPKAFSFERGLFEISSCSAALEHQRRICEFQPGTHRRFCIALSYPILCHRPSHRDAQQVHFIDTDRFQSARDQSQLLWAARAYRNNTGGIHLIGGTRPRGEFDRFDHERILWRNLRKLLCLRKRKRHARSKPKFLKAKIPVGIRSRRCGERRNNCADLACVFRDECGVGECDSTRVGSAQSRQVAESKQDTVKVFGVD